MHGNENVVTLTWLPWQSKLTLSLHSQQLVCRNSDLMHMALQGKCNDLDLVSVVMENAML